MPCYDGRDRGEEMAQIASGERVRADRAEAMLCAILTQLEKDNLLATVMSVANWDEAGISHAYAHDWWEKHKAMDEFRRKKEADAIARRLAKEERERQRQEVLARLSPEERKILGVR